MDSMIHLPIIDAFEYLSIFITIFIAMGILLYWFFIAIAIELIFMTKFFFFIKPLLVSSRKLDLLNKSPMY